MSAQAIQRRRQRTGATGGCATTRSSATTTIACHTAVWAARLTDGLYAAPPPQPQNRTYR